MPTVKVNLDTTQYVQVNTSSKPEPMILQAHRDSVRITLSNTKPTKGNPVFHVLGREDPVLPLSSPDTNVWALATSDNSTLIVTETEPFPVIAGRGDLATDVWGTQKVSFDKSLFHGLFTFDVPPTMWFVLEDGVEIANSTSTRALRMTASG